MADTDFKSGWAIFSTFVWLHLALFIYPLPFQRAEQIKNDAEVYFENMRELGGSGSDEYSHMNTEQLERELKNSYWATWIINFLLLIVGLLSTLLLYKNHRYWPLCLGIVSILCLGYYLLQYKDIDSPILAWLKFIEASLKISAYQLLYMHLFWPIYLVTLSLYSMLNVFSKRGSYA